MAMTNEQLTKWIDEIFGTIDEIKQNSGDITGLTRSVRQLREDLTATQADVTDLEDQTAGVVFLPKAALQHFTDGSATQALDLVADIIPVQAGTGDPSPTNVRAITGYSSVTATAKDKNLLDAATVTGKYSGSNTVSYNSSTNELTITGVWFVYYIVKVNKNTKYTLSRELISYTANGNITIFPANAAGEYGSTVGDQIDSLPFNGDKVTFSSGEYEYIALLFYCGTSSSGTTVFKNIQLETGEEATTYEPYTANTATLSLGSTVYGGSVDFTTGKLTVSRALVTYDGSEDELWTKYGAGSASEYAMQISQACDKRYLPLCNYLETVPESATFGDYDYFLCATGSNFITGYRTITTVEDWRTYLGTHNLTVCYVLSEYIETTLTPTQLQLLQGENNVSATSGPITLTYAPDNVLAEVYAYIQKRFDTLAASLTAARTTRKTTKTLTKKED